jgi:type VI secretion system protein VasG
MVSVTNINASIGSVANRQPIFNSSTRNKTPANKAFLKAFAGVRSLGKNIASNIKKTGTYTLAILKGLFKQTQSVKQNIPVAQNLSQQPSRQSVNASTQTVTQETYSQTESSNNEKSLPALAINIVDSSIKAPQNSEISRRQSDDSVKYLRSDNVKYLPTDTLTSNLTGLTYNRDLLWSLATHFNQNHPKLGKGLFTSFDMIQILDKEVLSNPFLKNKDWNFCVFSFHDFEVEVINTNYQPSNYARRSSPSFGVPTSTPASSGTSRSGVTPPGSPSANSADPAVFDNYPGTNSSVHPNTTPRSTNPPSTTYDDLEFAQVDRNAPPPPPPPPAQSTATAAPTSTGHKEMDRVLETLRTAVEERITGLKRWNEQDKRDFVNAFATTSEKVRQAMLGGMERMHKLLNDLSLENFVPIGETEKDKHPNAAAFVHPNDRTHKIHFTQKLFQMPFRMNQSEYKNNNLRHGHGSELSQTWLLAHELSHFADVLNTDDINYDNKKNAADFANFPGLAAIASLGKFNADNVAYYLEFSKMAQQLNTDHNLDRYALKGLGAASYATPALDEFAENFTEQAKNGEFEAVSGRNAELKQIIESLSSGRSPILLGSAGTGKTTLVKDLAVRIAQGNLPKDLPEEVKAAFKDAEIRSLNLEKLTGGKDKSGNESQYVGVIKGRFDRVFTELAEAKKQGRKIFLFIDEFHKVKGAGNSSNSPNSDIANMIKPYLGDTTGKKNLVQLIAATTPEEFQQYIETVDAPLASRFDKVTIKEPNIEDTKSMMRNIARKYADNIVTTESAIEAVVRYADQYDPQGSDPRRSAGFLSKAIDKVAGLIAGRTPAAISLLESDIESINNEIQNFRSSHARADSKARIDQQKKELENKKTELATLTSNWNSQKALAQRFRDTTDTTIQNQLREELSKAHETQGVLSAIEVDEAVVAGVLREKNGIVIGRLTANEAKAINTLGTELNSLIKGQSQAIDAIVRPIRGAFTLPDKNPRGPLVKLTLAGPPGTGKTETAERVAKLLNKKFIPLSMGNYGTPNSLSELTGLTGKPSPLTEVLNNPGSVLLLDELNQAHPDVRNFFYDILDKGVKKVGGQTFNFKNTIIMMTTNVGQEIIINEHSKGTPWKQLGKKAESVLKQNFEPAFISRMGKIVPFLPLNDDAIGNIVAQSIQEFSAERDITIGFNPSAIEQLKNQFSEGREKGARAIKDLFIDLKGVISEKTTKLNQQGKSSKDFTFTVVYDNQIDDFTVLAVKKRSQ